MFVSVGWWWWLWTRVGSDTCLNLRVPVHHSWPRTSREAEKSWLLVVMYCLSDVSQPLLEWLEPRAGHGPLVLSS